MRTQQTANKHKLKRCQRRYDRCFGRALLGDQAFYEICDLMHQVKHCIPLEIRAREIALEFLTDGRFDRVERKFYYLDQPVDGKFVVLLDNSLLPEELDSAGNLWGKQGIQWQAIKMAMSLIGWQDKTYNSYGWRWSLSECRNSDNAFLRWIYRTHNSCACVNFKKSQQIKTHRFTQYYCLYV